MNFSPEHEQEIADQAEDISTPAYGGKWHLIGYGILVPLGICYFALKAWMDRDALWISTGGIAQDKITGDAARAMAVVYVCAATFMHFRWCWGLLGFGRISHAGVAISLYLGIGGMFTTLAFWIGGV